MSAQVRHRGAAAGAQGAAAGAGGAAVAALADPGGAHRIHRPAAVAAAGGAGGGAVARGGVAHGLQRARGLGEQGQAEEFIFLCALTVKLLFKDCRCRRGIWGR